MKKISMLIMAVALVALPTMAQQEWQSTSSMQGSGSSYSAQVTAVGAAEVTDMATTTGSTSGPNRARRAKMDDDDWGTNQEGGEPGGSPIGDAVLPLMLLACAYLGLRVFHKRKRA